jgi:hypothetical protein
MNSPPKATAALCGNDGRTAEDILYFAEEEMIRALVAFNSAAAGQLLELVGLPILAALRVEAHDGDTTRPLVSPRLIVTGGVLLQPEPPATADTLEAALAACAPDVRHSRRGSRVRVQAPALTAEGERLLQADVSVTVEATRVRIRGVGAAANVAADRAAIADLLSESERDDVKDEIGELMKLYNCLVTENARELLGRKTTTEDLKGWAEDEEG